MKRAILGITFVLYVLLPEGAWMISAQNDFRRVSFQITTFSESAGERKILAQTTIEGLPGTDFNINLQTKSFKMQTRFLSDLIEGNKLKIRANLETRRFYGFSPVNLPLYEEDLQKQTLEIGFNEKMVLLPFGRNESGETLKIEIIPTLLSVSREEAQKPIDIKFDEQIPGGEISIKAVKIPHHYEVEAVLSANGEEIARGKADCLYEEEKEIVLQAKVNSEFARERFAAKVTINEFSRSRPDDLVGISFDFYQNEISQRLPIIEKGAGINRLGGEFIYRLKSGNLPQDKNYELKFTVNLKEEK